MRLDERPAIDRLTMGAEYDELREAWDAVCLSGGDVLDRELGRVEDALEALHLI